MPSKGVNIALAAAVAYPLGAWAFTLLLVVAMPGADRGWWAMLLRAPVAVPLLTLQHPDVFMFVWLACVLLTSFVIYGVIRRAFAPRPAN
jgi:hypothetical protein